MLQLPGGPIASLCHALSVSEAESFLRIAAQRELLATRISGTTCAVRINLCRFEMPCIVLSAGTGHLRMHEEILLRRGEPGPASPRDVATTGGAAYARGAHGLQRLYRARGVPAEPA